MAGKTNEEVWNVIKAQFNLDDKKKGYPAWYRANLKRKGLKPPTLSPESPSDGDAQRQLSDQEN
jgi:hypothetical protein